MHVEHSHTAIDHIHIIGRRNISDRTAAPFIYLSKFGKLIRHFLFIKNPSDTRNILCPRIITSGFSPSTRIFIKYDAMSKICGVFLFKYRSIQRIISRTHIRRKHFRTGQCAPECNVVKFSHRLENFGNCIFKKSGAHTGGTHASDFFFINKDAGCCTCHLINRKHSH